MDSRTSPRATLQSAARFALIAAWVVLGALAPRPAVSALTMRQAADALPIRPRAILLRAVADELPSQRLFLPALAAPGVTQFASFGLGHAGGSIGQLIVEGRYAYVGEGSQLSVYEIGGSGAPRMLASSGALAGEVVDLTTQGSSYLFARTARSSSYPYGKVHVFDIGADPVDGRLQAVSYSDAIHSIYDLSFHGQTAYVCDATGLRALDARDPQNLVPLGALPVPDGLTDCQRSESGLLLARCVRKCGNQASQAANGFLWRAIDVRDPADMRIVRELGDDYLPGGGEVAGYLLSGDRLYLRGTSHGTGQSYSSLRLFDVADPLNWRTGGTIGANQSATCANFGPADGTRVYAGGFGTCIYDWSDAAAAGPRLTKTLDLPAGLIAAQGDRLAVIGGLDLRAYDVADADAPGARGSVGLIGAPTSVAGLGAMRVALSGQRLSLIDSSLPGATRVVATWDAPSYVDSEHVLIPPSFDHRLPGRRMPVFDGKDLQVVDLDPSASPLHATAVRLFDEPVRGVLAAQGQWVVVAAQSSTRRGSAQTGAIIVIQVDPAAGPRVIGRVDLSQVGSLNPGMRFSSARIAGDRVYLTTAQPSTLAIVDLAVPAAPVVRCWLPLAGALAAVAVRDGVAYVAAGDAGLHVVRVTVPEEAAEIGTVGAGRAVDLIEAAGPKFPVLYVADAGGKLWLFDISNPTRPTLYTYALVDGQPQGLSVDVDDPRAEVWVAAAGGGLFRFGWMLSAIP